MFESSVIANESLSCPRCEKMDLKIIQHDRMIEIVDKKTKEENVCVTKVGLSIQDAVPQKLKSVNTGRDKATIENPLKFVSMCHISNAAAVYCLGFVESRRIQCREYH